MRPLPVPWLLLLLEISSGGVLLHSLATEVRSSCVGGSFQSSAPLVARVSGLEGNEPARIRADSLALRGGAGSLPPGSFPKMGNAAMSDMFDIPPHVPTRPPPGFEKYGVEDDLEDHEEALAELIRELPAENKRAVEEVVEACRLEQQENATDSELGVNAGAVMEEERRKGAALDKELHEAWTSAAQEGQLPLQDEDSDSGPGGAGSGAAQTRDRAKLAPSFEAAFRGWADRGRAGAASEAPPATKAPAQPAAAAGNSTDADPATDWTLGDWTLGEPGVPPSPAAREGGAAETPAVKPRRASNSRPRPRAADADSEPVSEWKRELGTGRGAFTRLRCANAGRPPSLRPPRAVARGRGGVYPSRPRGGRS